MDIQQWLQNTADREPPDEGVEAGFPAFLQPQSDASQPRRRSRQKRKRASSDPLRPARQPSRQQRGPAPPSSPEQAPRSARESAAGATSRSSSSSQSEQRAVSDTHEAPIETFEKRARHKTKPDRYEPKQKRKKNEHKSKRQQKPESRRRRSHRSGDGSRTTGLVQSFQLKNGPKKNRLTLKPEVSAGIFKHGRASGPIVTSGPGLPDLVFNEMRFLRKPKEHQDELPDDPAKSGKKTRKQIRDEEISAYFNKSLPPNKQAGDAKPYTLQNGAAQQRALQRPPQLDLGRPKHPVELPEKAFLGFGSRGPPQDGLESQPPSNSYYTWSESVPAKHSPAVIRPTVPALNLTSTHSARQDRRPSQVSNTPLPRRTASVSKPHHDQSETDSGQWLQSRRVKAPALVEVYQPPGRARRRNPSAANDLSEPLPRATPVFRDAQLEEMNSRWEEGSYHTSDILKIRDTIKEGGRSPSLPEPSRAQSIITDKENHDPVTSTPTLISERLRHTFSAVTKPHTNVESKIQTRPSRQSYEERAHAYHEPSRSGRAQHHVQQVGPDPPRWQMPQRGFSRTSDASRSQQRPPTKPGTAVRPSSTQQLQSHSAGAAWSRGRIDRVNVDEDEMLDVPSKMPLIRPDQQYVRTDSRAAEDLVRRLASDQENNATYQTSNNLVEPSFDPRESAIYQEQELQMEPEENFVPGSFASELFFQHPDYQPSGGQFQSEHYTAEQFQGEHEEMFNDGQQEAPDAELTGFWKPNILY